MASDSGGKTVARGWSLRVTLRNRLLVRLLIYVRANPGSVFIVAFMVLLMGGAGSLVFGRQVVAEELAVYAYYALVVGVVLQLVSLLRR